MSQSTNQQTHQKARRQPPVIVKVGPQQWILNHGDDAVNDTIYHDDVDEGWDSSDVERQSPITSRFPNLSRRLTEMEDAAVRLFQSDRESDAKGEQRAVPARQHRKRLRESFEVGLIIGLILGCISLVMFHQVEPSTIQAVPSAKLVEAAGSRKVTMPAVTLDRVVAGTGLSPKQAKSVQDSLKNHGISSSLWRGKHGYDVVTAVSMGSADLQAKALQTTRISGSTRAHIETYHRAAAAVSVGSNLSQPDAEKMSEWLSAVGGSLNTIIAVSADHASVRDAAAAYHSAQQLMPSQALLKRSGYSVQLTQLVAAWQSAYSALSKRQNTAANIQAMNAVGQILQIEYVSASS